ncbi:MAG: tetratricopeptide repeat protein [Magnetococcales bacterium]|nr:tetratricopeptide repeat protein [Magnetococcales bacterium]
MSLFFCRRWPVVLGCALLLGCTTGPGLEKEEQEFQTLFDKGKAYLERGNPQMALPALQQANRLQPGNVALLARLGLAYDQVGRPLQALESLEEAHRLRPDDSGLNNNLGVARLRVYTLSCAETPESSGCPALLEQAERALQAALQGATQGGRQEEGVADIWFNLALLYKQRGQEPPMVTALEKALEINGHHLPARLELAEHHHGKRHFDLEKQQLRHALAAHPDQVAVMERLADALFALRPGAAADPATSLTPGELTELRTLLSRIVTLAAGTEASQRASQRILLLDKRR